VWRLAERSVGKGQEESDPEAYLKAAEEYVNRPKGNRISHRIAITSPEEIDDEVKSWFKAAYDLEAKGG